MNAKEYIASGVLELYVLGALTTEEAAEVEQMAEVHPAVQAAIQQSTRLLSQYAKHFQEAPPAALRKAVLRSIDGMDTQDSESLPTGNVPSNKELTVRYAKVSIAASVGFIVLGLLTALNFYLRWQDAAALAAQLKVEKKELVEQMTSKAFPNGSILLGAIVQSGYQLVPLKAHGDGPKSTAWLSWDPAKKEAFVWLDQLPAPPATEVYQLWGMHNGQPTSLGTLHWGGTMQPVPVDTDFQSFAITREPVGGSEKPSLAAAYWTGEL